MPGTRRRLQASEAEVDYLCAAANGYFAQRVTRADVVWTFSGVRPLYDDGANAASAATRDYVLELDVDGPPLVSIFGGKITTYRRLAEHVLDMLDPAFPAIGQRRGWTGAAPLPGGAFAATELEARVRALRLRYPWLHDREARRLTQAYGLRANEILGRGERATGARTRLRRGLERERGRLSDAGRMGRMRRGRRVAPLQARATPERRPDRRARPLYRRPARRGRPKLERAKDARVILVIDQGTTSTRAIVFGADAAPVASAQAEFPQIYPRPGWVEHDPEALWRTTLATAREALKRAACEARGLAAIGVANQRETTLIWERSTGRPIANAIVWQDRRTAEACAALKAAGAEPQVTAATGLVIDPYFSATKIAWLLDNVPGARTAAERGELAFGTVDTFLLWRLTNGGVHATDATNASRTMLYDIRTGAWDDATAAALPRAARTAARSPGHGGRVRRERARASRRLGADPGADRRSAGALIGQACFRPGMVKSTYGTGCFRSCQYRRRSPVAQQIADDHRLPVAASAPTRSKARSSRRARRCNGCATVWALSPRPRKQANSRQAPTPAAGLSGAGLHRARRSPLGQRGPRRDLRVDARRHAQGDRPRGARERRLSDPRPHRRDARRFSRLWDANSLRSSASTAA